MAHGLTPTSQRRLVQPSTAVPCDGSVDPSAGTGAHGVRLERMLKPPEQEGDQLFLLRCLKPKPRERHRKRESFQAFGFSPSNFPCLKEIWGQQRKKHGEVGVGLAGGLAGQFCSSKHFFSVALCLFGALP